MSSKLKRIEPFSPLISMPFLFWLPVARRVASKLATAPPVKRARNRTASSTSLLPFFPPRGVPPAMPPVGPSLDERPLLDERLGDRADDFGDLVAGDEAGHVDDVRVQVAVRAGAGVLLLEPPEQRHVGPAPVLEVNGADVEDPPELPVRSELVRQRDGRHAAVVVPDERLALRRLRAASRICRASASVPASGFSHATCLPASSAAIDMLRVHVVRRADVDQADGSSVTAARQSVDAFCQPQRSVNSAALLVAAEDRVHHRQRRRRRTSRPSGTRWLRAAHELLADEADVDRSVMHPLRSCIYSEVLALQRRASGEFTGGGLVLDPSGHHHQLTFGHRRRRPQVLLDDETRLPSATNWCTTSMRSSTIVGASPSDGSSIRYSDAFEEQRAADGQHLLFTAGELRSAVLASLGESREQLVHRGGCPPLAARSLGQHGEVLVDAQRGEQPTALRDVGDAATGDLFRVQPVDPFAGERDLAGRGLEQPHQGCCRAWSCPCRCDRRS